MNRNKNSHRITVCASWVNVLVVATSLWATSAFAQWTWLDKDGRKVYSDTAPPASILDKNIIKRPGGQAGAANTAANSAAAAKAKVITDGVASDEAIAASAPGASAPQVAASAPKLSSIDKDLEKKKKEKEDAEAAKKKEEEQRVMKAKIETCARAKTAKATLDSGVRIGVTNAKGEREIMDDSARAAEVIRVQGIVNSSCR
jgi:Domain of unknown function (DUF4124)